MRTSRPRLCTWIRAPSSFHSNATSPPGSSRSASPTSAAVCASMGATGANSSSWKRPRPALPCVQGAVRHAAQAPGVHGRAAHLGHRQVGGCGDGFDHEALERALAQLAGQQVQQKLLLLVRGLCEERPEGCGAPRRRSRTAQLRECGEPAVNVGERQRRARGRRRLRGGRQQRIAHTDAPLGRVTGQVVRGEVDFRGRERTQEGGEFAHLGQAAAAGAHALRSGDQCGQEGHAAIVAARCRPAA